MAQMAQNELGNAKPIRVRSRGWTVTLNNYTEEEYVALKTWAQNTCSSWVIGKEVGEKCGTPHLQCYFAFKNPTDFNTIKVVAQRAHIEKARGKKEDNLKYCTKEGVYESSGMIKEPTMQDLIKRDMLAEYDDVIWKPWQQNILDIIKLGGSDRKINWVYDPVGNNGKSFLRRYICLTNECVLADGKKDNIFNQFKVRCIDENKRINICVLDIPRQNETFTNYGVIEAILDRHLYSGKYEGGEIFLDRMTVIVFANFYPKLEQCTSDRWNIIELETDHL